MDAKALLPDVKNYLDITWEDDGTDNKLIGILERGKQYLLNIAGYVLTFEEGTKERELLFDYTRYVRSNALDEFQVNYRHELIALRLLGENNDEDEHI